MFFGTYHDITEFDMLVINLRLGVFAQTADGIADLKYC